MANIVSTAGSRVWLANLIIIFITAVSLYDIVRDSEHWPFSQYAMYSYAERKRSLSVVRLVGVAVENETSREIPLQDFQYIQPFDQSRLRIALDNLLELSRQRPQLLREALEDCLTRYERLRLAGRHDGPRLRSIRLYRLHWQLDPWARNVEHPDSQEMLAEVELLEE